MRRANPVTGLRLEGAIDRDPDSCNCGSSGRPRSSSRRRDNNRRSIGRFGSTGGRCSRDRPVR